MTINYIKETCLYVKDLQRTKQFYEEILQLPLITFAVEQHVFFRAGSSVLLFFNAENTKTKNKLPPHFGQGQQHFAFETNAEDYEIWKTHLISKGIEIEQEVTWKQRYKSFYFRDPDLHLLEFVMPGMWE